MLLSARARLAMRRTVWTLGLLTGLAVHLPAFTAAPPTPAVSTGTPAAGPAPAGALGDDRGQPVAQPAPPRRIVTMLPSLTETVCALQACERLVGTDRYSNWPASVRALPKLGGLDDAQLEQIVALKPDLVLVSGSARVAARLQSLGIPVLALEANRMDDVPRVMERVAGALGRPGEGRRLWAGIEHRIDQAAARVPAGLRGQRVYFEVDAGPYAAGASSFVGELLTRLGLQNIVPASMGPFPRLNPEFVVKAQPDLVMASADELARMASRPGWSQLRALKHQRQCGFDTASHDLLVRPGPRTADAADALADCLVRLPAPVTAP